jgi:hypothetical protein
LVLHKKTQLTIIIPIGQICLSITQEDTTNNSNWKKKCLGITQEDTTNNSNSNWTNLLLVLHKKTQLTIPIPIGKICLGITQEDTNKNSIPIGQICLGITQEDTTNNSNWTNLSWYYTRRHN